MAQATAAGLPGDRGGGAPDSLIGLALITTAIRCVLRYVVLPFGLPLLGLAPGVTDGVTLVCDLAAVVLAVSGVWRVWSAGHAMRWRYLLLTCAALGAVLVLRLRDAAA